MKDTININGTIYKAIESLNESKWHDFTKSDWYGYAGATQLPDGSEPKIYSKDFDRDTGIDVILSGEDYDKYGRYNDDYTTCAVEIEYFNEDDPDHDLGSWVVGNFSQRKAFKIFNDIIDRVDDIDDMSSAYEVVSDIADDYDMEQIQ